MKIKFLSLILALSLLSISILGLSSCSKLPNYSDEHQSPISFKAALSYDYLKSLDGTVVTINGYMATNSSPVDGSYIYLMNLPYQSCPYCIPNTNQLANTMTVYAPAGSKFDYTDQAIKVTGILEVSPSESQFFTDYYGYEFNFKIVDAIYEVIDEADSKFNELAKAGIYEELNKMYEYLNFVTYWFNYTSQFQEGEDYLYPQNAYDLIVKEGYQYNYGYKEGYFDSVRAKVLSVSATEYGSIIALIDEAEALATDAFNALEDGLNNETIYKAVYKQSSLFGDTRWQYEYLSNDLQVRNDIAYGNFISAFEY